jgi:predicted CXXCH cytochrome family protein
MTRQDREPSQRTTLRRVLVVLAAVAVLSLGGALAAHTSTAWAAERGVATAVKALAQTGSVLSPHGNYVAESATCSLCHRAHAGKAPNLLPQTAPQSKLCFTCHDGTGSTLNVASQFGDPTVPANDPATRSYYSHPSTTATTAHTGDGQDEFTGTLNRHAECSDCHNPHSSSGADSTSSPTGTAWTLAGPLTGASGVSVVNGAAGTAPSYTFLDGVTNPVQFEYQLCLKCHSGNTVLLSNTGFPASQKVLDAGVEFNPNSISSHPVEGPGSNQTTKMGLSLAGTSPYKKWTFTTTSTIRCTNCHGNDATVAALPAPGGDLAPHASSNRGILIANYRDRLLTTSSEQYSAANFALCYLCHTDSPFSGQSATATNFQNGGSSLHYLHVSNIRGSGTAGTSIDTAGAGNGNALCAECHFRIHSTATTPDQNQHLVSFSPNVTAVNGTLSWNATANGGSCTLRCHGMSHQGENYG